MTTLNSDRLMMNHTTMRAIRVHHYGGADQLRVEDVPLPTPNAGELLVRVQSAGVLPMDCYIRSGKFASVMPRPLPYTPGTAFAGVVEAVGAGVTTFRVGDAICGRSPGGTYANYTTMLDDPPPLPPTVEGYRQTALIIPLALKPKTLNFDEASTLSGGATTAWNALFEDGAVQAGQRVLIHGAAGGVGLFAVQFAKWKGAEVIATTSTTNVDFLRTLGADNVIDYTTAPFEESVREVDFVLDTIGGSTLERSMRIVKRGGMLVSVVETPTAPFADELGIRAMKNAVVPTSEHLRAIVAVIDASNVRPSIRQPFALEEARLAHQLVETGHGRGRVVLHITD